MSLLRAEKHYNNYTIDADHVVIWSGGCDSTLLLKEVAEQYGTVDKPIVALSVNHYLIDENKNRIEKQRRETILEVLKKQGLRILHTEINISGDASVHTSYNNPTQAYIWLSTVLPYIKDGGKFYLGYIRSDDATMKLSEIRELHKSIDKFLGKDTTLMTPYILNTKEDIISELMSSDLYKHTWYCEMPKDFEPCRNCQPCKTHQMAIIGLACKGDEDAIKILPEHVKIVKKYLPHYRRELISE